MLYSFFLIILTKSRNYKSFSKKSSVLKFFTHELNKNNKISFLDVLIDTNNNNFTTSTYKKASNNNSCTLNFKSERPFRYKKQLLITWYPVPNWSPPPKQYFIMR